jgi:hypothetical protein
MATISQRASDLSGDILPKDAPFVKLAITIDGTPRRVDLDLTPAELATLEDVLKPYFDAVPVATGPTQTVGANDRNAEIRRWATANPGFIFNGEAIGTPSARGRLSQHYVDAYDFYLSNAAQVDADDAAKAATNGNGGDADNVTPEFQSASKGRK